MWLEMNDTLIISFQGFDWISAVSRKVLTLLESALRHFEVEVSVATKYDQLRPCLHGVGDPGLVG